MKKLLKAGEVKGVIVAPASKSIAQRAIVAAGLTEGTTLLKQVTLCDDTRAAMELISRMGCVVIRKGSDYRIRGGLPTVFPGVLFCGESGLLTRMITPVAALSRGEVEIRGCGSLLRRPMDMVVSPLGELGVSVTTAGGRLPLKLEGTLRGGEITLDGSVSSQVLTGLLMALPLADGDSLLHVHRLNSKPYVDLTIRLLSAFGIEVRQEDYSLFRVKGRQQYRPCVYTVEGDWSGASCLLVAGAISGQVTVKGLDIRSVQADRAILEVLELAGIPVVIRQEEVYYSVTISKGRVKAFDFDATECPDLFPAITALAVCADGVSCIRGADRLTHKESNRAFALQEEFGKLGIRVTWQEDCLFVTGGKVKGGVVQAHRDHRMVMALATVALLAEGDVVIEDAEVVAKSYPGFWEDFARLTEV